MPDRQDCGALQKQDPAWLRPSGRVGAAAKELQGFGAPALLLDTLELAAGLRPRVRGISASVDGALRSCALARILSVGSSVCR